MPTPTQAYVDALEADNARLREVLAQHHARQQSIERIASTYGKMQNPYTGGDLHAQTLAALAPLPAPAPSAAAPAGSTVEVRIAVAVTADDWNCRASSNEKYDAGEFRWLADSLGMAHARYLLTATLPVPEVTTVQATVERVDATSATRPELDTLLAAGRNHVMTDEEREAQRQSWARGERGMEE